MLSGEATNINFIAFGFTRSGLEPWSIALDASMLTITPLMWLKSGLIKWVAFDGSGLIKGGQQQDASLVLIDTYMFYWMFCPGTSNLCTLSTGNQQVSTLLLWWRVCVVITIPFPCKHMPQQTSLNCNKNNYDRYIVQYKWYFIPVPVYNDNYIILPLSPPLLQ